MVPTKEKWAEIDYQLAYNKYKERFANAGDFEFFFVGNIDDATIEKFSKKYPLNEIALLSRNKKNILSGFIEKLNQKNISSCSSNIKLYSQILDYFTIISSESRNDRNEFWRIIL
jgi:hypothetical protein